MAFFDFDGPTDSEYWTIAGDGIVSLFDGINGVTFTLSSTYYNGPVQPGIGGGQFSAQQFSTPATNIFTLTFTNGTGLNSLTGTVKLDRALSTSASVVYKTYTLGTKGTHNPGSVAVPASSLLAPSGTVTGLHVTGVKFTLFGDYTRFTALSLTGNLACFTQGTAIATRGGDIAVEDLRPGDRILTATGAETAVTWVGRQEVPVRFLHPARINPICIRAHALAEGIPARDLWVSQDHAIAIDGLLINAGALVNGRSIYQVERMPLDGFTYYHIETGAHELLLAEGVAAETFIDYAGRDSFVNGDERAGAPVIREMDLPRISAARLVPADIQNRLDRRATAIARRAA